MRTPRPEQAAADFRHLARILASGDWARALELADDGPRASTAGSGGRGSVGDHSDPTGSAALSRRHDPFPQVAELVSAYDAVRVAVGARGAASHHWVAGKLQGEAQLIGTRSEGYGLLWVTVDRCLRLYRRTIPWTNTEADQQQRRESERAARYCAVCEAPLTPAERRSMCEPDYWAWRNTSRTQYATRPEGDPGSDRAEFTAWMRARISDPLHPANRGVAVLRPGSPLVPDSMPTLHEAG